MTLCSVNTELSPWWEGNGLNHTGCRPETKSSFKSNMHNLTQTSVTMHTQKQQTQRKVHTTPGALKKPIEDQKRPMHHTQTAAVQPGVSLFNYSSPGLQREKVNHWNRTGGDMNKIKQRGENRSFQRIVWRRKRQTETGIKQKGTNQKM